MILSILGHASVPMTLHYTHVDRAAIAEAAVGLERAVQHGSQKSSRGRL